jgi:DNA-binding NarL/FixJ family response regulator
MNRDVIRVLLVSQYVLFRKGICSLLKRDLRFEVIGEASTGRDALVAYGRLRPDIVLMDAVLPDMDGRDAARRTIAQDADARIVMLTTGEENVLAAVAAGARMVLPKETDADGLFRTLELLGSVRALAPERLAGRVRRSAAVISLQPMKSSRPKVLDLIPQARRRKRIAAVATAAETGEKAAARRTAKIIPFPVDGKRANRGSARPSGSLPSTTTPVRIKRSR